MSDWKPIETAPLHIPILVWCPKINRGSDSAEVVIVLRLDCDDEEQSFWTNGGPNAGDDMYFEPHEKPTHWMHLPKGPQS